MERPATRGPSSPGEQRTARAPAPFGGFSSDGRDWSQRRALTDRPRVRRIFQPAQTRSELVVDHQAASLVEAQAFQCGISGQEDAAPRWLKARCTRRRSALRERAVKDRDSGARPPPTVLEPGEHSRYSVKTIDASPSRHPDLANGPAGSSPYARVSPPSGGLRNRRQQAAFPLCIAESWTGERGRRRVIFE